MRNLGIKSFLTIAIAAILTASINAQNFAPKGTSGRTIEQQIAKKLRGLTNYSYFDNITYTVNGSVVTLYGKVYSLGTIDQAENVVEDIDGVSSVINKIEMLPPSPFDDRIRREAIRLFASRGPAQYFNENNPDVRIIVDRGRITLEGNVSRKADSDLLNVLANSITGVFEVTNNLTVSRRSDR
ncbi:MAG: BON domain-containing protein [Blastocatellia bacterium]|jgi:hyperosmotically inducible protein|nr:BON domain-containing protein [Blastocatellia bacterium]